ncbi:MAG: mandelate racemase/muconate lactonizing enzyme family protein [Roseiarcus sp.]
MKVAKLEILSCDAGWRNYFFLKLTLENGVVGWSEFDEWYASPGVSTVIEKLSTRVVGQSVFSPERIIIELLSATRPAARGVVGEGIGAIENALLDAKAKVLGVPCHQLLGGKLRDRVRVYWSHCATWRILHPRFYPPAIRTRDDVRNIGAEARQRGFGAIKTNIFIYGDGKISGYHPGFAFPFAPELTVDRRMIRNIRDHLEALREGAGPDMDILVDLNFNARTDGYIKIMRALEDFDFYWVELDVHNPEAVATIRRSVRHPIASCETLFGAREFLPYFQRQSVDTAIVDAVWNGVWQSCKVAHIADAMDVNVALHNFYGHLSTFMNVHLAAATANFQILETDVDRLSWDAEIVTHAPEIRDGYIVVPDRPGWGTEPIEAALRDHPPKKFAQAAQMSSEDAQGLQDGEGG